MNLDSFPAGLTDWSQLPESVHPGASGTATVRERRLGEIHLRLVTYTPNFVADHWCGKGHLVFVVAGELVIEHQDERSYTLHHGMSYHVADDDASPHRVLSDSGATLFIVD